MHDFKNYTIVDSFFYIQTGSNSFYSKSSEEKLESKTNLRHEKREGLGETPKDSPTEASLWPKKAAKEGIEASPLAHIASFSKCSTFNKCLAFEEDPPPLFCCFFPIVSSLSDIALLEQIAEFATFLDPLLLPIFCSAL
ncbi:hypothetical protein TorRG33x02_009130 [Trema orientale]|uniref:Uncharacterized protein n=1 Tax=Trema orientale TaxID=63057 RepID=A0A2P5FYH5_TREOI|nr:hypothetical protein TorRG33x02_009130 [Trema orientale]